MPEFDRRPVEDDLEIASRVMDTVQKQIASYRMSLEKLRGLRKEIQLDSALSERVRSSPQGMMDVLTERGIPQHLAAGMVAEDYQDEGFDVNNLGFWTWDCCCTACCITCICTAATICDVTEIHGGSGERLS